MKVYWFWVLVSMVTALLLLSFSSSSLPDMLSGHAGMGRKLKEWSYDDKGGVEGKSSGGDVTVEDYHPIDPSPSSKAIKPAPIEHGTPLIPHIPKPSPPAGPLYRK